MYYLISTNLEFIFGEILAFLYNFHPTVHIARHWKHNQAVLILVKIDTDDVMSKKSFGDVQPLPLYF